MSRLFLSFLSFLAVAGHSDEPSTDPNDPVYKNKPLSTWLKELNDRDPSVRKAAAYAMRDLGPAAKTALPALFKILKDDPSPEVREWAGYALASVAPTDSGVLQALLQAMQNDASEKVRGSATAALSNIKPKPKSGIPELKQLLKHNCASVRKNAVQAIAEIEDPKALTPILMSSLGDKDATVRETIAWHLAISPIDVVPALSKALADEDPAVRAGASLALGNCARFARQEKGSLVKDALPSILGLLRDKESAVREGAAETLYLFASKNRSLRSPTDSTEVAAAIPGLIAALKDQDATVRSWSVLALGTIGPDAKAAVPGLTQALLDQTVRVRQVAAAALGRIGPQAKSAVPALIVALKDTETSVRWAAASGLAGIGPDAREALAPLREAASSENRELQQQAENAVKNINVVGDVEKDSKKFAAIIIFWQQKFPGSSFEGAFIHRTNGPRGNWLHIHVPPEIETLYQHPFSREFLEERLKEKDNLPRAIAFDLLSLKQPLRGIGKGGTISYDSGDPLQCIDYTVIRTWDMLCQR